MAASPFRKSEAEAFFREQQRINSLRTPEQRQEIFIVGITREFVRSLLESPEGWLRLRDLIPEELCMQPVQDIPQILMDAGIIEPSRGGWLLVDRERAETWLDENPTPK